MREKLKACFPQGRGVFHRQFAGLMADLDGRGGFAADQIRLAAVLLSYQLEQGEICLRLERYAGRLVLDGLRDPEAEPIEAPTLGAWLATLRSSGVVGADGEPERPLLLAEDGRLYLRRYWDYQQRLLGALQRRARDTDTEPEAVRVQLDRLFETPAGATDWQRLAAALALHRRLCVITGGAGTGKTTTVLKILTALRQLEGPELRIALAAPTGKAAARLSEAIRGAKSRMDLPAEELAGVPEAAGTIHRLLGVRRHTPAFRHDATNPLPIDCLVLDEASMVDLALMSKLVDALPEGARLIMLGDPHQLSAVEAGSVLADLAARGTNRFSTACAQWLTAATGSKVDGGAVDSGAGQVIELETAADSGSATDTVVELQVTHRNAGNIVLFAEALKRGEAARALAVLDDPAATDVAWHRGEAGGWLDAALQAEIRSWFDSYRHADPFDALRSLDDFRLLCAHREGAAGVAVANALVERALRRTGAISGGDWYPGRPVMVTRNDYALGLYNGDVGVCLPDEAGVPRVWFPGSKEPRAFAPGRLPEHETVFAMTVHKTQGSEFGRIVLLLPERESPIVNRALLYTAVTRAKQAVRIHGSVDVLAGACRS